jgi:cytoskeletal protein CcmA (bactofilin family)
MFGKSKRFSSPLQGGQEKFETIIGPQVDVQGHLRVKESVRIDGTVIGDVQAVPGQSVTVVIGPTGKVQGNIVADFVVVAGQVLGNIEARERVELHPQSRVEGDTRYASIAIEHGATVLGLLLHTSDKPAPGLTAVPGSRDVRTDAADQ